MQMRILWTFKYTLLTFPDRDPAFPHMASQVYFLPVAHRPKSPEQQNLCPSRNLFLSRNRRSKQKSQYNEELSILTFRAYSESFSLVIMKSGSRPSRYTVE